MLNIVQQLLIFLRFNHYAQQTTHSDLKRFDCYPFHQCCSQYLSLCLYVCCFFCYLVIFCNKIRKCLNYQLSSYILNGNVTEFCVQLFNSYQFLQREQKKNIIRNLKDTVMMTILHCACDISLILLLWVETIMFAHFQLI